MFIIGSQALSFHGIDTGRPKLDYDLIGTFDELGELTRAIRDKHRVLSIPVSKDKTVLRCDNGLIVEFEIAWTGTAAHDLCRHIEMIVGSQMTTFYGMTAYAATLDVLYTLKMSHRYLKNSPHFRKTRDDIMLMRRHGAKIFDAQWLKKREDETYWYKHPKLNVKKDDFFKGDGVQYVYDHDDIHKAVAHYCSHDGTQRGWFEPWGWTTRELMLQGKLVPAYRLYMRDGAEVQCDKEKFFSLPEHIRLWGVLEEAYVLALERSQIPFRGKVTPRKSFDMALMKVCTSITSGWFREFGWENFDRVEAMYSESYVDCFWDAVEAGMVRKLEPGEKGMYE